MVSLFLDPLQLIFYLAGLAIQLFQSFVQDLNASICLVLDLCDGCFFILDLCRAEEIRQWLEVVSKELKLLDNDGVIGQASLLSPDVAPFEVRDHLSKAVAAECDSHHAHVVRDLDRLTDVANL